MSNGFFRIPKPENEKLYTYAPGTPERAALQAEIRSLRSQVVDVPMYIGAEEVRTDNKGTLRPPHDHQHVLGYYHKGEARHVRKAIEAALAAKRSWEAMPWYDRAAIFLRAAELLAGPYRNRINAATMLGQSKTAYQAEIDSAAELIDFLRFNAYYLNDIYSVQPDSAPGVWNRMEYRPLEGFVFALTPFNFTAIAGNLPSAPALMGNTVVWKAAEAQIYSANVIMQAFREAGLPPGVINLVFVSGPEAGEVIFRHQDFAGIHFTGSTGVFQHLWKTIGENIQNYRSYPRIVGETGGKDFVLAHPSADPKAVAVGLVRGAFEFQGQKCSAASRAYLPASLANEILDYMKEDLKTVKIGGPEDFTNFFTAVIDEKSFDKCERYITATKNDPECEIIFGGGCDKSKGWFVEPTVILSKNPTSATMCEEIFGPVLTIHIYEDKDWHNTLELVDRTGVYALTGAVFARDREAIGDAMDALRHAAGNFYINDKPTGAVVNQQPFGGGRASGTNDKAGSIYNLLRWVSVRSIKETFVPPTDYRYPFLQAD